MCIKILDLLRRAGGTRDDAALSEPFRVPAMARDFLENAPALRAAGHCTRPPVDPGRTGRPDTFVSGAVMLRMRE
jgi:hypothetical protein